MTEDASSRDARMVAEMDADIGVHHVAAVCAEARLGATEEAGETETVLEEFDSLVVDVFVVFPRLEEVLSSGLISAEEKDGILDRTLAGQASRLFLNFLKVVGRHGRLGCRT